MGSAEGAQPRGQHATAIWRQDALRVELDRMEGQRVMAEGQHDGGIGGDLGSDGPDLRQGGPVRAPTVVMADGEPLASLRQHRVGHQTAGLTGHTVADGVQLAKSAPTLSLIHI